MSEELPFSNSIFWIEVGKISPNPFQPRKEFDQRALESLADSIKQYGVLQPLVVTRKEFEKPDGGIAVEYELIAGERRLRASKLAGLLQVPAVIRPGQDNDKVKLEIAIIENLQREDLNPIDRAEAFKKLLDEFGYKATEVAKKIGMSREYVSNTVRMLGLPAHMIESIRQGEITEGHSRPLLMLTDKPAEQETLYKDIKVRRLSVRDTESAARHIAVDKVRKHSLIDPEIAAAESQLTEKFGTKVEIQKKQDGGRIMIDYFSPEDLKNLLEKLIAGQIVPETAIDDRSKEEKQEDEGELYSVSNFTV
ncbi:MAG TPA: ParB/RepB/Spo0J family partition protein [Candidatus Paceibacterota bacterium]